MKVTVTTLSGEMFPLDVNEEIELENFKALCEFESGIPSHEITILWNGMPLHDNAKSLKQYGLKENEVLLLQHMRDSQRIRPGAHGGPASGATGGLPMIDFSNIPVPGGRQGPASSSMPFPVPNMAGTQAAQQHMMDDPATVREILLRSPRELSLIKERNPELAESLLSGSLEKFTTVFRRQQQERQEVEKKKQKLLNADPFDAEAQKLIAEEIRLKNVESNMETAMEYSPESFGQVVMLYIDCTVNGHPVKAFVDSGAQMTIMSQRCAERCNIMRLVDTRWAGLAKGVGTQKIIGRVHLGQIQIGKDYLQSSFSILEDQPMDMLLGLDMLKRHQCCIDLKRNMLVIGTTGAETPFLSESELPENARLNAPALDRSKSELDQEDHQLAEALAKSAQEASSPSGSQQSTSSNHNTAGEQSASAASSAAFPTYPESTISRLMSYGYGRQQVIEELRSANGNADQALVALLAKSLP